MLDKQGKLSPNEWRTLRSHPEIGDRMIRPLKRWLGDSADVVVAHHERWDGTGYPKGLGAGKASRYAGIVAVTDAFEAMTAPRRYRAPLGIDEARDEIEGCAGTQFDPRVVEAFLRIPTRDLRAAIGSLAGVASVQPVSALISSTASGTRTRAAVAGVALTALAIAVGGGVLDAVERGPLAFADREGPLAELDLPPGATTTPRSGDPASPTTTTTTTSTTTTSTTTSTTAAPPAVSTTTPAPIPAGPGVPPTVTPGPGPAPLPTTTTTPPISTSTPPTTPPSTPAPTTTTITATTVATTTSLVVPPVVLPVKPSVSCVTANGLGGVVARFGYANPNSVNVGLGIGPQNAVAPGPANQGQPTLLSPGVHQSVFTVDSGASPTIGWTLQGSTATASASSPAC